LSAGGIPFLQGGEDVNEQIPGYNNRKEAYIKARLEKAKF
jgi:hypothetical protein